MRTVLLIFGFLLLACQNYVFSIDSTTQFIIFLIGILFLGIPHGAADLLVASRNASSNNKKFSKTRFLAGYLARLSLFALLIWLFPVVGICVFVLFAAYHFGETDLNRFNTDGVAGKLFVASYGLFILSIILVHHFQEVRPIIELMTNSTVFNNEMNWINDNRYLVVSIAGIFFFASSFLYFLLNSQASTKVDGEFLIQLALIIIILFNLPMLLGFSFYFIFWHSVISLRNIIGYLRQETGLSMKLINKQLTLYSLLSIVGIVVFGWIGFSYLNEQVIAIAIFLGLAVLTAPHMEVMHEMYSSIRAKKGS
jgi:beta-carotene 15,15'-dioxygenase